MKDLAELKKTYESSFGTEPTHSAECGGRFEILGNHTDHNHGLCLAATCDLTVRGVLGKRTDGRVIVLSKGYAPDDVDLGDLSVHGEEKARSSGLVRGIASYLKDHGYEIGGFQIVTVSGIFPGAGVSSSAAFELLIAQIFNVLYNDGSIPRIVLCQAGQFAENNYFGKKSGLLDQIGVGYGNISYIDFKNIASPTVLPTAFPFDDLTFVLVNTGGSHAALNDLYSAVPGDMLNAARKMGHSFLVEGSLDELQEKKALLSDIEYGRAYHFYGENKRVKEALEALREKDEKAFLDQVNGSRCSSTNYLKNMMVGDQYSASPAEACDYAMETLGGKGACKINGGGFAGSIVCVVPKELLKEFRERMSARYGEDKVREVGVRKDGPVVERL